MTPQERRNPDILKASRKRRIAAGSGVDVAEVNRLLKQHQQMADMFKMMSQGWRSSGMAQMAAGHGDGRRHGRHGGRDAQGRHSRPAAWAACPRWAAWAAAPAASTWRS